jgi:NSS family neurotransmitter:Na+ symporter
MIELATRVLIDAGISRRRAIVFVGVGGVIFGLPSARSLDFLHNQDWVWGVGLMLSGLFFAFGAQRYGLERLRRDVVNADGCDLHVGKWWSFLIRVVVPLEAVILMIWWLKESRGWDPSGWLNPFGVETVGTVLMQWAIAIIALVAVNRWLAVRSAGPPGEVEASR